MFCQLTVSTNTKPGAKRKRRPAISHSGLLQPLFYYGEACAYSATSM